MQVTTEQLSPTKVKLTIKADPGELQGVKDQTLRALAKDMKVSGFRAGKIPLPIVEKNANPAVLQQEFLERAMNLLYGGALEKEGLRPVAQPEANVAKFVPYETLEMSADVEVIGEVKPTDYKKIKVAKDKVEVTKKDLDDVIKQLQVREAVKNDVDRAAADGDQVWIDFTGVDAKSGEPIQGADGKQYPLVIGSNTFIPGFEPHLVGLKAGDEKTFQITFPADYGVASLQKKKVEFTVLATKVQEVVQPKLDDDFAATVGPFKSIDELKSDIEKQVSFEKQNRADREYENKLLDEIVAKSKAEIPESLVEEEIDRLERDERQDLTYRGQTWQEHLDQEGVTEKEHREKKREEAARRVKAGLVLAEIAELEKIEVTREELDGRLASLRSQYTDKQMQAELDKPENRQEIASRLLTEKTVSALVGYASN